MSEPIRKAPRTENATTAQAKKEALDLKNGPFSVLQSAMETNTKVIVRCRFDRMLVGYVRAFDKHFNMLLTDVNEVVTNSKDGEAQQRVISTIVLRGDSVVYVLKLQQ